VQDEPDSQLRAPLHSARSDAAGALVFIGSLCQPAAACGQGSRTRLHRSAGIVCGQTGPGSAPSPDESGFRLLQAGEDGVRRAQTLIDRAQYSLDLQYYLGAR